MALIFFDLDGTLLYKGKPANGVLESIEALKRNGHTLAIATGRSPVVLDDKDKELGIYNLILANGNYVVHNKEIIYEKYIPHDLVNRFKNFTDEIEVDLVLEYNDLYVAYRKNTLVVDDFSDFFQIQKPKLDRNSYPEKKVFAMVVFGTDKIQILRDNFPELEFNISNSVGYDVNLKGDLKAKGVRKLIKYLDYPLEEVYAIGDGHNDILMLKEVKYGIAMNNASNQVKAVADFVTTDVNDYGVMKALKHYKLI